MSATYRQVFTAVHEPKRDVCGVGVFSGKIPSVQGHIFHESDEALVARAAVPDLKCWRHVGRAGCLALLHFKPLADALRGIDRRRIGIYSSISVGTPDWTATAIVAEKGDSVFTEAFRRHTPPKQIFRHGPNIPTAILGTFLEVTGPHYSFQDWSPDLSFALDQARVELAESAADVAVVVGAYALDDQFQNLHTAKILEPTSVLCEATACLLLTRETPKLNLATRPSPFYFGSADALTRLLEAP